MATMSLQAAYDQARSYLEANKVEQAIGVAQHILEHFPESLEAHRILGEAYLAGRQFEQAEAAFARVLRADPEDIPAHVGLGITFERQGKLDHAVAEFEQALEVRPDMPELRSQLLRLYTDIWGSEGATLRLSRPGLARLYAKGHMLPQAIQEYRSVIEEQPERFDARVGLAEALWRNQQEQQAAEVCSEILALRPDVLKANLLLGYIKLASGDPDGEPFWRQAQRLDPYQHVARSLFETLPDLPAPNVQIPAWDEARWAERRAREEAERRAAQAAVATAAVAAAEPEPELAPAWGPAKASVTDQGGFDADDLLASLLAMEPPVPTERGVDLDTSSGVVPFSLEDIDGAAPQRATTPAEPELEPFSLADLGLSDEEIAQLRAEPEPLSPPPAVALPATLAEADQVEAVSAPAEPELAPFSLEDLGLSPEEIAQLEAAQAAAPGEPEPPPFSPNKQELPSRELSVPGAAAEAPAAEESDLGEITPFSLDEFDLNTAGFEAGEGELPPSLRPFSIDEPPPATAPSLPEEVEEGAYSWQQPAAKPQPGFARRQEEETPGQGSIFERLKTRAAALPPQEPEPLRPISDEELAQSDYFSHDDVSLRDEESGGQNRFAGGFRLPREDAALIAGAAALTAADRTAEQPTAPPAEPELTPFSLEELGLSPEEIAQLEAAQAPATPAAEQPPAEPELTPFSLEELGLSPEEIAQLEAAQAPAAPVAEQPPAEPELTPFSLEELGLSPEEITQLEAAQSAAAPPAEPAEPELTPFSLEELGLSPEEIAQLEAASRGELPLPATGETIVPGWSRGEEPELTPFALDEQSPEAAASGAELDLSGLKPFSPEDFGAAAQPSAPGEALPEDVEPFSFDDLDLGDLGSFDGQMASRELGLSAEELEGLDLGQFETILPEHRDARATTPEQGDAALERLMGLGRRQGYVDLTDIIAVVSDPEAEAERIETIGWALHRAGIQIRDGDEIIDMEEGEAEGDIEAIAPAPEGAEAEVAPFSLEELGLSPEEIAALGLTEATAAAPVAPSAEPELTPFSLEELGLSPEEIAQLEAARAAAEPPAAGPATEEQADLFDFDLAEAPPVEKVMKRTAPRVEEPPPAVDPADAAFQPEPLDSLDDIWQTPLPPPPAPPATRQEPPQEAPARREPIAGPTAAPPAPVARRDTAPAPRREGGRLITRGRDEERFARREAARLREPASRRGGVPLTMRLSDLAPTGDATLDEYLRQLEGDPENSALALAIGRLCAQTGRADVMVMAYKGLIRAGHDLDLLAEELEGLIDAISDGEVQRHIFRLLGDAYARQGRSRDAIAAYGQAFAR